MSTINPATEATSSTFWVGMQAVYENAAERCDTAHTWLTTNVVSRNENLQNAVTKVTDLVERYSDLFFGFCAASTFLMAPASFVVGAVLGFVGTIKGEAVRLPSLSDNLLVDSETRKWTGPALVISAMVINSTFAAAAAGLFTANILAKYYDQRPATLTASGSASDTEELSGSELRAAAADTRLTAVADDVSSVDGSTEGED